MPYGLRTAITLKAAAKGILPLILAAALFLCSAAISQAAGWGIRAADHKAKPQGARITRIESGSPADRAGLKEGDIILEVDGKPVQTAGQLAAGLKAHPAGEKMLLLVHRQGWSKEVELSRAQAGAAAQGKAGLGAQYQDAPQEGKPGHGAMITDLAGKGPADKAGLGKGDVITYFNGRKIFTSGDLDQLLEELKPGQKVMLSVARGGWEKDIDLVLGREKAKSKPQPKPKTKPDDAPAGGGGWLGVGLNNTPEEDLGALVTDVLASSPAQSAGIKNGDIITFINGRKVFEFQDVVEEVKQSAPGSSVEITLMRGGKEMDLDVVLGRIPQRSTQARPPGGKAQVGNQAQPVTPDPSRTDGVAWLGLTLSTVSSGLTPGHGAMVEKTTSNSPALHGGVQVGDVVTHFSGRKISGRDDLIREIQRSRPGKRVEVTLYRNGTIHKLTLTMGQKIRRRVAPGETGLTGRAWLGVSLADLGQRHAADHGALVVRTAVGSPARAAGIKPGDVITSYDGTAISSRKEVSRAIRKGKPGQEVRLTIFRDGAEHEIKLLYGLNVRRRLD
jgi:S1-C subfamily serine protease